MQCVSPIPVPGCGSHLRRRRLMAQRSADATQIFSGNLAVSVTVSLPLCMYLFLRLSLSLFFCLCLFQNKSLRAIYTLYYIRFISTTFLSVRGRLVVSVLDCQA